jgi:peptidyl-prolyl cis-trans isomerase B (cyclophilin B)
VGLRSPAPNFRDRRHYDVRLVTRADKRQRQKERSRAAREAREAAFKRQQRKSIALRVGGSLLVVAVIIAGVSLFTGGDDNNAGDTTTTTAAPVALPEGCVDTIPETTPTTPTFTAAPAMQIDPAKSYTAKLSTTCGDVTIALDAANAPTSVNNFVFLARQGFYDGLMWPRAAANFVIQTGSPDNTQEGGPGYTVQTEVPAQPGYAPGAVAWAKSGNEPAGTAGSQFFIVTGDGGASLPADYGTIGAVTAGLENAQKITSLAPDGGTGDGPPSIAMYLLKVEITEA